MRLADGRRISFHVPRYISSVLFSGRSVRLSSFLFFFFPVGANLSASWLQSSKKVQTEKRRERDGVREDGELCVEEGERWCGGGMQRKRQERRGGKENEGRSYGQQ